VKRALLLLEIRAASLPTREMPPNCEILARSYVGDQAYGLLRHPNNRALYLASLLGYFELDLQQLLATFSEQLRAWDRDEAWTDGRSLTGIINPETILLAAPPAPGARKRRAVPPRRGRAKPLRVVAHRSNGAARKG